MAFSRPRRPGLTDYQRQLLRRALASDLPRKLLRDVGFARMVRTQPELVHMVLADFEADYREGCEEDPRRHFLALLKWAQGGAPPVWTCGCVIGGEDAA